jgi:hypothetical protein
VKSATRFIAEIKIWRTNVDKADMSSLFGAVVVSIAIVKLLGLVEIGIG